MILVLLIGLHANSLTYAEISCDDHGADLYPYQSITPLDYSITNGKFVSLCANPDYLYYTINLDTTAAGSLIIEIPKESLDLKQFDYESCFPNDLSTNIDFDRTTTVTQIAQTDISRTLEFTWNEPIIHIVYFGTYAIIDGVDYSEPNYCIGLVESGEKSEVIEKATDWREDNYCPEELNYDYEITNGKVKKICYIEGIYEIVYYLDNVTSPSILTIDMPYTHFPRITKDNFYDFIIMIDGEEHSYLSENLQNENSDYQTYEIKLPINSEILEIIGFVYTSAGLVESEEKSAEIKKNTWQNYDDDCIPEIITDYTLNYGKLARICEPTNQSIMIITSDIIFNSILTIDIPYTKLPLMTTENYKDFILLFDGIQTDNFKVIYQYPEYQTFEIDLISDVISIELFYNMSRFLVEHNSNEIDHEYNLTTPLLDIEKPKTEFKIKIEKPSCKSNLVEIMKPDSSKYVCIKPTTAEKLILRGWINPLDFMHN